MKIFSALVVVSVCLGLFRHGIAAEPEAASAADDLAVLIVPGVEIDSALKNLLQIGQARGSGAEPRFVGVLHRVAVFRSHFKVSKEAFDHCVASRSDISSTLKASLTLQMTAVEYSAAITEFLMKVDRAPRGTDEAVDPHAVLQRHLSAVSESLSRFIAESRSRIGEADRKGQPDGRPNAAERPREFGPQ